MKAELGRSVLLILHAIIIGNNKNYPKYTSRINWQGSTQNKRKFEMTDAFVFILKNNQIV